MTVSLDEGFVAWVDGRRGSMPRSRFIEAMMRAPSKTPDPPGADRAEAIMGVSWVDPDEIERSPEGPPSVSGKKSGPDWSQPEALQAALSGRAVEEVRSAGEELARPHLATCQCGVCRPASI